MAKDESPNVTGGAPAKGEATVRSGGSIPLPKSKRGLKSYFGEVVREMKKVSWPNSKETNRLTGVVLAVCGALVAILATLSVVFDTLVKLVTAGGVN